MPLNIYKSIDLASRWAVPKNIPNMLFTRALPIVEASE